MKKFTFFLIYLLLICQGAFAQVPEGMNYQCVVRNSTGGPVINATVKIKFSVLPSFSGTAVYAEEQVLSTNQLGIITAVIGQGVAVTGAFGSIDWAGGTKFLKVETDIGNTGSYTDAGTSQLVSVPYAMVAKKSLEGNAHQTLSSYLFTTTQRGVDAVSPDSLVVAQSGTYLVAVSAEGYGITYNPVTTGYGDNGVLLKLVRDGVTLTTVPLHDYKKDDADFAAYNLTPRQSTHVTTLQLSSGSVLHPVVRVSNYGTGGTNTNGLGYISLEVTLVKLQ